MARGGVVTVGELVPSMCGLLCVCVREGGGQVPGPSIGFHTSVCEEAVVCVVCGS